MSRERCAWRSRRARLAACQSHRCPCRQPRAVAAHAAGHEPGEARRESRSDLPAGSEVREGHQPHRRQPAVRSVAGAGRPGAVLLRGAGSCRSGSAAAGFGERPAESYAVEFLGSREGLELNKAFARITDPRVRRSIVDLVRAFAGEVGPLRLDATVTIAAACQRAAGRWRGSDFGAAPDRLDPVGKA